MLQNRHLPFTSRIQALRLSRAAVFCAILMIGGVAVAEVSDQCASSKLANELLHCSHCQAMKKLLSSPAIAEVSMEVHGLPSGAIIEIEAGSDAAVALAHDLAREMWGDVSREDCDLSSPCRARFDKLELTAIDLALSDHGAIVVLHGECVETAQWLRDDAGSTQRFLLSAASR